MCGENVLMATPLFAPVNVVPSRCSSVSAQSPRCYKLLQRNCCNCLKASPENFSVQPTLQMHQRHSFNGPLPGSAGTRKVKPVWILLKQETVSGSGISWAICKCAPRSRQDNHASTPPLSFYRPDALPAAKPTASKH